MYVDTFGGLRAIREYVVSKATLIIDNNQALYWPVKAAALEAVQNDTGQNWTRDDFVMMLDGRGGVERAEIADVVGVAVCDVIGEWLDLNDPLHAMLADLLDLGDETQRRMFGEHYMPEADEWPEDNE